MPYLGNFVGGSGSSSESNFSLISLDDGSEGAPSLSYKDDVNLGIYSPAQDNLAFVTNGTERLRIASDGNVGIGIGTNNPAYKLEVEGDIKVGENGTLWFSDTANSIEKIVNTSGTLDLFADSHIHFYESDNNVRRFTVNVNMGQLDLGSNLDTTTAEIHFDYHDTSYINGSLFGLGTTSPASNLQVEYGTGTNASTTIRIGTTNDLNIDKIYSLGWGDPATTQMGMGPYSTSQSVFGNRHGLGIHVHGDDEFSIRSTSWNKLFAVEGGTGRGYFQGNVGIGTNNPLTKLEVVGDITITNGTQNNVIRTNADGQLQFMRNTAANNTVAVTINDEDGNVGIGTTSPDTRLHVAGAIKVQSDAPIIKLAETGVTGNPSWWIVQDAGNFSLRNNNTAPYAFQVVTKGTNNDTTDYVRFGGDTISDALTLTAHGTNPTYLDLKGNNANARMRYFEGTTERWNIGYDTGIDSFTFYDTQSSATRFVLKDGGNVGIGTTSPDEMLEVAANGGHRIKVTATDTTMSDGADYGGIRFETNDASSPGRVSWDFHQEARGSTGLTDLKIDSAGTNLITIEDSTGNVGIGTTAPSTRLHVSAGSNVLAGLFQSSNTSVYATFMDANTTANNKVRIGSIGDGMRLFTGGTDSVRIDEDGNVGIGTINPTVPLHVKGSVLIDPTNTSPNQGSQYDTCVIGNRPAGDNYASLTFYNGTSLAGKIDGTSAGLGFWNNKNSTSGVRLQISAGLSLTSETVSLRPGNQAVLTARGDGNVGIGTDNPSEKLEVDGVILSSGPIVDTVWYKETWPAYNETTATLAGNDLGTWTLTGGTLLTGTPADHFLVDLARLPSGLKAVRWVGASAVSYFTSPTIDLSDFRTNEKITTVNQTGSFADRSVSDSRIYLTMLLAAQSMDSSGEHMEVQLSNDDGVTFHEHQAFVWQDGDPDSINDTSDTTWRKVVIDISEFVYKPSTAVLEGFKIRFKGRGEGTGDSYGVSNIYIYDAPIPNKLKAKTLKLGDASLSKSDDLDYDEYLEIVSSVNTFKGLVLNGDPAAIRDNYVGVNGADSLVLAADELNAGDNSRIDFRIDGKDRMKLYTSTNDGASEAHLQLIGHTTPTDRSNWRISAHDDGTKGYFAISDYSGGDWNENLTIDQSGNVGIGTDSPSELLTLGSAATSNHYIRVNSANNSDSGIKFYSDLSATKGYAAGYRGNANFFFIQSDNAGTTADRLVINDSGNVGIGTDNPIYRLSVDSSNRLWNVNDDGVTNYVTTSATNAFGVPVFHRQVANRFHFGTAVNGTGDLMLIDNDGNVGIGTTDPTHKLHVEGDIRAQYGALILSYADADNIDHLWHDDTSEYGTGGSFVFNSDATYKNSTGGTWSNIKVGHVYVDNGNLGTTVGNIQDLARFYANNGNATSIRIQAKRKVAGTNWNSAGYKIFCQTDSTEQGYIEFNPHTTTAGDGNYDVAIGSGSDEIARFKDGGNVGIGTNNPVAKLEVYGNARFKATDGSHGIELYPDVGGLGYQRIISFNRTSSAYEDLSIGVNDFIITNGSSSEALRITSGGNVGIGTFDPQEKLSVAGTALTKTVVYTANQDQPYLIAGTTSYTGAATSWGTYGFQHRIKSNSGGTGRVTIDTHNGEAFCVTNPGNVGIGTNSPSQKLHVVGNIQINGGVITSLLTSVIADDAYEDVVMPVKGGMIAITSFTTYDTYAQPTGTGLVYYDAGTSKNADVLVDVSNTLAVSTSTATTVGTFTDGKTTIAMVNTTGTIRIWNRTNASRQYKITLL